MKRIEKVMIGVLMFGCAAARAADPIALWDNRFASLADGNVTLSINGNTVASDSSSIRVEGAKGISLDWLAAPTKAATIYVKYSGLELPTSGQGLLASFYCNAYGSGQERPGLAVAPTGGGGI